MGLIRLLLAFGVVMHHGYPATWKTFVGSTFAVQCFFLLSGFYMALVLSGKYASPRSFYVSRFYRLFPLYWVVLFATVVVSLLWIWQGGGLGPLQSWFSWGDQLGFASGLFSLLSNILIIGQDAQYFLRLDSGSLVFEAAYYKAAPPHYYMFQVLPQMWSVASEIVFYLLAPFLVRLSTPRLALVMLALFASWAACGYYGFTGAPWNGRFIPGNLALFILGMLSYRLPVIGNGYAAIPVVVLLCAFYALPEIWLVTDLISGKGLALWLLIAVSMPAIFKATAENPVDRFLGELSYPVYVVHWPLIHFYGQWFTKTGDYNYWFMSGWRGEWLVFFTSVILSAALHYFLQVPIDRYRHDLTQWRRSLRPEGFRQSQAPARRTAPQR